MQTTLLFQDIPYIACGVCERAVREVYNIAAEERAAAAYNKLEEIKVVEAIESVCEPDNKNGEWIRKLDIVETKKDGKTFLSLEAPGGSAKCERECATIAKSCRQLFDDDIDQDEFSAMVFQLPSITKFRGK